MSDLQTDLKKLRALIQKMGWGDFMRHVGSVMAEQSDHTDGRQSDALAACSRTVHALDQVWTECGRFIYPEGMLDIPGKTDD